MSTAHPGDNVGDLGLYAGKTAPPRWCPAASCGKTIVPPESDEIAIAEMPAGSVLLYTGNVLHGAGANRSNSARFGLALHYNLGWLRQEENQYLAVPPEVARELPVQIRELLGYSLGSPFLGFVDHIAPNDYIDGVRDPAKSSLEPPALFEQDRSYRRFQVSDTVVSGRHRFDVAADGGRE